VKYTCDNANGRCDLKKLCSTISTAGVPHELKWKSLFLFISFISEANFLSSSQKENIQKLAIDFLFESKFTDDTFDEISNKVNTALNSVSIEAVNKNFEEIMEAIRSSKRIISKRSEGLREFGKELYTDIDNFKSIEQAIHYVNKNVSEFASLLSKDAENLEKLCNIDQLTQIRNRRCFENATYEMIQLGREHDKSMYIALLDIDNFKLFNDRHGHLIGDQVLQVIGQILLDIEQQASNNESMVSCARYGGEEFVVYINNATDSKAFEICEQIRNSILSTDIIVKDVDGSILSTDIKITCSIGLSKINNMLPSNHYLSALKNADDALYVAKKSGKNMTSIAPA